MSKAACPSASVCRDPLRSPQSGRESDGETVVDADPVADADTDPVPRGDGDSASRGDGDSASRGDGDSPARSAAERIRLAGESPAASERDLRCLADIARDPLRRPLATVVAALVVCALGYQSSVVAVTAGPAAGLLSVAAVTVAYAVAKRLWAVQHRYMVAELAAADELDRLR